MGRERGSSPEKSHAISLYRFDSSQGLIRRVTLDPRLPVAPVSNHASLLPRSKTVSPTP